MIYVYTLLLFLFVVGCTKTKIDQSTDKVIDHTEAVSTTGTTSPPKGLAWEVDHPERAVWSRALVANIKDQWAYLKNVTDANTFCKKYYMLEEADQQRVWAELFVAMAYYESGWNPLNRYTETSMGKDPVTGKQVVSEGLLQLSFQDEKNHPAAKGCGIDWEHDKKLSETNIERTILSPIINLKCGVAILAYQIKRHGDIVLSKGLYWSTLRDPKAGKSKVPQIAERVQKAVYECK